MQLGRQGILAKATIYEFCGKLSAISGAINGIKKSQPDSRLSQFIFTS